MRGRGTDDTARWRELELAERRARLLADASLVLGSSLEYTTTIAEVCRRTVPELADWCAVEMPVNGHVEQIAVAHVDPEKVEKARELRRRYPPNPKASTGIAAVLQSGRSEMYPSISDEMLVASAVDEDHLRLMREIGMVSAMVVPMDARGRVFGALVLVSCHADRRFQDADLRMAEDLGRRMGMAIDNARLYREAVDAVTLRDDFLAIAGHELRTPLTSALLQVQRAIAARNVTGLDRAVRSIKRLSLLIDRLLQVSSVAARGIELRPEHVDLEAMLKEIVDRVAPEKPVRLRVAERVVGYWDRAALEQVFTALIDNALKYGEERPVEVHVARADGEVTISVRDHGMGISQADQDRIFRRYERAVSVRNFGGFGLGLWLARENVAASGGKIRVWSEPGKGSEFVVELPINGVSATAAVG